MLARATVALAAYGRARARGEKYEVASIEAVEAVRARYPNMPMSKTALKRLLAEFQPEGADQVFVFAESAEGFSVGIGPRPRRGSGESEDEPAPETSPS